MVSMAIVDQNPHPFKGEELLPPSPHPLESSRITVNRDTFADRMPARALK
jgi:hypothetical protein